MVDKRRAEGKHKSHNTNAKDMTQMQNLNMNTKDAIKEVNCNGTDHQ